MVEVYLRVGDVIVNGSCVDNWVSNGKLKRRLIGILSGGLIFFLTIIALLLRRDNPCKEDLSFNGLGIRFSSEKKRRLFGISDGIGLGCWLGRRVRIVRFFLFFLADGVQLGSPVGLVGFRIIGRSGEMTFNRERFGSVEVGVLGIGSGEGKMC
jgi:hypothetical protein